MLEMFKKHCSVCGMDVDKEMGIKRFGKYFCSDEHGSKYAKMRMANETSSRRDDDSGSRGGCC